MGQKFSLLTMLKLKICNILLRRKNSMPNFSYAAKYMKMYQIVTKTLKKCWRKVSHFCIGPKTRLGYCVPCFKLSSKIPVVGSTFLLSSFEFGMKQNLCQKFLFQDLTFLRDPKS